MFRGEGESGGFVLRGCGCGSGVGVVFGLKVVFTVAMI